MSESVRGDAPSPQASPRHSRREAFPDLSFQAALKADAAKADETEWVWDLPGEIPPEGLRMVVGDPSDSRSSWPEPPPAGPLFAKKGGAL
ncbi:hypothetical protein [Singulisphaera sp. PoT]|uniref:hypothetical protein n=1 Tax=Singulisphaera sp. PoT TaxID=3411797 RepID=UPI003BF5CF3B